MIAIVTDSTSCMTKSESREWGIRVIPVSYYVDGYLYHETFAGQNGAYVQLLRKKGAVLRTSGAGTAEFLSAFEELLRRGFEILCLTLSSRLSGTYSSASAAAQKIRSDKLVVLDSLTTGGGLLMLAKAARQMALSGKTLSDILFSLEQLREKVGIVFSVDDMRPLRQSGRIGVVRQSVGTVLNRKPLLSCTDGIVVSDGIASGRADQIARLIKKVPENTAGIIVHYLGDESAALKIKTILESRPHRGDILLRQLGPVLGVHLGTGVTGIAWMQA